MRRIISAAALTLLLSALLAVPALADAIDYPGPVFEQDNSGTIILVIGIVAAVVIITLALIFLLRKKKK